jgi:hypothetical protein
MNVYIWSNEWLPWKNTVAYYPLTSTSTVNDMSWNGLNLTNNGNVSFGTNYGVNCANFPWNWVLRNSTLTTQYFGQTFTISEWVLRHGNEFVIWTCNNSWTKRAILTNLSTTFVNYSIWTWSSFSDYQYPINSVTDQWYHIVMTHDNTGALVWYLNWQQIITWNITVGEWASNFWIWASVFKDSEIYYSNWAASEIIIENRAWTSDQIAWYYNQTKSLYWLS